MAEEKLMTVEEFTAITRRWALLIEQSARAKLMSETHSSGNLARQLRGFVDSLSPKDPPYRVKFRFERYGVFRAYGAGRGYVVYNGILSRGYRLKTKSTFEQWQNIVEDSLKKGMTSKEINAQKGILIGDVRRRPLDWIDGIINRQIGELADSVQEFYGDKAVEQALQGLNKVKINKNG